MQAAPLHFNSITDRTNRSGVVNVLHCSSAAGKQVGAVFFLIHSINIFDRFGIKAFILVGREAETYLDLFRGPLVQVDRLDSGYVNSQVPVDAGAADADEDSQVPGRPPRTCGRTGAHTGLTSGLTIPNRPNGPGTCGKTPPPIGEPLPEQRRAEVDLGGLACRLADRFSSRVARQLTALSHARLRRID